MKCFAALMIVIGVLVAGCGGSGGPIGGGGGGTTVNVSLGAMDFTPQSVNAHAGDSVKWTNNSANPHTVTSDTGEAGLSSSTLNTGGTFTWAVPANATIGTHFFYHCVFHGTAGNGSSLGTGMVGEVVVN